MIKDQNKSQQLKVWTTISVTNEQIISLTLVQQYFHMLYCAFIQQARQRQYNRACSLIRSHYDDHITEEKLTDEATKTFFSWTEIKGVVRVRVYSLHLTTPWDNCCWRYNNKIELNLKRQKMKERCQKQWEEERKGAGRNRKRRRRCHSFKSKETRTGKCDCAAEDGTIVFLHCHKYETADKKLNNVKVKLGHIYFKRTREIKLSGHIYIFVFFKDR